MIPNLAGSIIARQVLTPLDLERTLALTGGHHLHGDMSPDQLGPLRPAAGLGGYRDPDRRASTSAAPAPTPAAGSRAPTAATARSGCSPTGARVAVGGAFSPGARPPTSGRSP